jgi:nitrogen fixation-related uncharacterized protein
MNNTFFLIIAGIGLLIIAVILFFIKDQKWSVKEKQEENQDEALGRSRDAASVIGDTPSWKRRDKKNRAVAAMSSRPAK